MTKFLLELFDLEFGRVLLRHFLPTKDNNRKITSSEQIPCGGKGNQAHHYVDPAMVKPPKKPLFA
jgi:hypothetical protein